MPPGKNLNNEPDPPETNSSLTTDGHNTRRNPRRTTSEEIEAIPNKVMDTRGAECYLQEKLLSIRDQPLMLTHLSSVLFHITQMSSGIPLPVTTAIRAVAFILKRHTACEIAEAAAKHFTNTIFTSLTEQITTTISPQIVQIQSLTETLKTTIHDTETLRKNMQHERDEKEGDSQTAAERIEEATNILHDSVNECKDTLKTLQPALETTQKHVTHLSTQLHASKQLNANHTQTPGPTKPTYSSVTAANLPPSVDQAMARAATRARQILITLKTGNNIFPDTNQHADIVKIIKQALTKASNDETPEGGVKSVQTLHSGAIIIELDTEELATWLRSPAGRHSFEEHLGPAASLRERTFSIVLQYLPVSLKIDHEEFLHQCEEENALPAHSLHSIRWIKPPQRCSKEQQRAFALLQVTEVETANTILKEGLCIQSQHITVQKDKKEPMRCVKCQHFGHIARNCRNNTDICGTCGNAHRTAECNAYRMERCVSCKSNNHTSWSRACPEFKRQCELMDAKFPENRMPFFPTGQEWTQTIEPPKPPSRTPSPTPTLPRNHSSRSPDLPRSPQPRPSQKTKLKQTTIDFNTRPTSPPLTFPLSHPLYNEPPASGWGIESSTTGKHHTPNISNV